MTKKRVEGMYIQESECYGKYARGWIGGFKEQSTTRRGDTSCCRSRNEVNGFITTYGKGVGISN